MAQIPSRDVLLYFLHVSFPSSSAHPSTPRVNCHGILCTVLLETQ